MSYWKHRAPNAATGFLAIFDNDPFIGITVRGIFQLIFKPADFAVNLPYPPSGGLIQPLLYPAVVSALFVLTLPLGRPEFWVNKGDLAGVYIPIVVAFLVSIIITPILIYLSAWTVNLVAILLESRGLLRRTIRVMGALVFWFVLFGLIFNLLSWGFFAAHENPENTFYAHPCIRSGRIVRHHHPPAAANHGILRARVRISLRIRVRRTLQAELDRALILTVSTYGTLMPLWLYLIVLIPLHLAGLI